MSEKTERAIVWAMIFAIAIALLAISLTSGRHGDGSEPRVYSILSFY